MNYIALWKTYVIPGAELSKLLLRTYFLGGSSAEKLVKNLLTISAYFGILILKDLCSSYRRMWMGDFLNHWPHRCRGASY